MRKLVIAMSATLGMTVGVAAHACDCPAAVTTAVEKAHAGAKTLECTHETDDGESYYEARIRTSDGKTLELELSTDGAIVETWEQIPASELPAAALQTLQMKHADAKVSGAERLTTADGEISFDVLFVSGGRKQVMTVTKTGAFVEEEDDEDEAETAGNDHKDD